MSVPLTTFSIFFVSTYFLIAGFSNHSGPNRCRTLKNRHNCCAGWKSRKADGLCVRPICINDCGQRGLCVSPNVCRCNDGSVAPVCVDERRQSDAKCENFKCQQKCYIYDGYPRCSCYDGFKLHRKSITNCVDIDECRAPSKLCDHHCVNTIGSYYCTCKQGFVLRQYGTIGRCISSQERSVGASQYSSVNLDHNVDDSDVNTVCFRGYRFSHILGFCTDVDECSDRTASCDHICINTIGSYYCSCHLGYIINPIDRRSCFEQNIGHHIGIYCSPQCTNGGSCVRGKCLCPAGLTGKVCEQDINECGDLVDVCQYKCKNSFGTFRCSCPHGFVLNADLTTCRAMDCIPECANGGKCLKGKCVCRSGFTGPSCSLDRNECIEQTGSCQYMCRNTYGSHVCLCPPGSRLRSDRRTCTFTTKFCLQRCKNGGSCDAGRCACRPGFTGRTCRFDVNECSVGKSRCSHGCYNTYGSYRCYCPDGMALSGDAKNCVSSASISTTDAIVTTPTPSGDVANTTFTEHAEESIQDPIPATPGSLEMVGNESANVKPKVRGRVEKTGVSNSSIHPNFKDIGGSSEGSVTQFVLAVNRNIVKSMLSDFKTRRRAIKQDPVEHGSSSSVLVSASSELPCFYLGSKISSGTEFLTGDRNCTRCLCQKGELRCSRQACPALDCANPVRGRCCDRCPDDCVFDAKIRKNREHFSPANDPCKTCFCNKGLVTCSDAPCPFLDCPVEEQFLPPGRCCAECTMVKKMISTKKSTRNVDGCAHRNVMYDVGESWVDIRDNCTVCECQNGRNVECFSVECLKDLCDNILVRRCCTVCRQCYDRHEEIAQGAKVRRNDDGRCEECTCNFGTLTCNERSCSDQRCQLRIGDVKLEYNHGDIFNIPSDPCVKCLCDLGKLSCFAIECPTKCSHGQPVAGECCPRCKGCVYRSKTYDDEESFVSDDDPCERCSCEDGTVTCNRCT